MKFVKMHGTGNDFIVLGARESEGADLSALAVRMCDRHFGVGADGIVAVLPSDAANFRMRIINPDGTEPEMCGNGIRCAVRYFLEHVADKQLDAVDVETIPGIRRVKISGAGDSSLYTVDMGAPEFKPELIPVLLEGERVVSHTAQVLGHDFIMTCVSMGNPHAVMFFDREVSFDEVKTLGPAIENHPLFPAKTNVEFARVLNGSEIEMKVWERGAGITLACGTGACATLAAAHVNGLCGKKATLHLPGGDLVIEWADSGSIEMAGPAETSFTGEWGH